LNSKTHTWAGKRTTWTVHLTLALPALLSALFNLALWEGLLRLTKSFIPQMYYPPAILGRIIDGGELADVVDQLVGLTAGPYFTCSFGFAIAAMALFCWGLAPVVVGEFKIPRGKLEPGWVGACLNSLLSQYGRWSGELLWAVIALTPIMYLLTMIDPQGERLPEWLQLASVLPALGGIVVLFLTGSKLPFKGAGLGFRAAVDIAMDVANWFRLNPIDKNPKARITSRFVSLLRHVCNWKAPNGDKYEAIVIISHSQGTIIAAEVLRFLKVVLDPLLSRLGKDLPVYLFTMGSPLKQLYALRFPHQYSWGLDPKPEQLNLVAWVNAYRSGDYVGRNLWTPDDKAFSTTVTVDEKSRRELCIGSGAHTKYWDETAPEVAHELDRLIGLASGGSPLPPNRAMGDPLQVGPRVDK